MTIKIFIIFSNNMNLLQIIWMNKLLIASHFDLIVYDPLYLNIISKKNADKLFIFLPNINDIEKNKKVNFLINQLKLNVFFIPDVESNPNYSKELFFNLKDFIIKKDIKQIYICLTQ